LLFLSSSYSLFYFYLSILFEKEARNFPNRLISCSRMYYARKKHHFSMPTKFQKVLGLLSFFGL
jgi:hypothetical protein